MSALDPNTQDILESREREDHWTGDTREIDMPETPEPEPPEKMEFAPGEVPSFEYRMDAYGPDDPKGWEVSWT